MNQRGRKSLASLAVVGDGPGIAPLMVPPGLTEGERGVWLATVNSKPADWFGTEHIEMMVDYARNVCRGHVVDAQFKAFDPTWMATDEGLRRWKLLVDMGAKISGVTNTLMRSMRLTHQAVYRADKAGMGPKRGKVWQREPS